YNTTDINDIFKVDKYRHARRYRYDTKIFFYNHHEAHALAPLFFSDWTDALLVTADAGGDTVNYSHRHFANGTLKTIYGGEECLLTPLPIDSIAYAYMTMTAALGFIPLRHEGKLTGLAAYGKPILSDKIATRFFVDENGRISSNFRDYPEMVEFIHGLAKGVSREDASASIQQVLESTMLRSIGRLLEFTKARHLGLAGGVFANVRLNRLLAEKLPIDEIFIYPAMGDEGMPAGGALCYLLQRDGLSHWLSQRRRLPDVYFGRDYTNLIDDAMAACPDIRRTKENPVEGTARRLNAGQLGAIYVARMEYGPRA